MLHHMTNYDKRFRYTSNNIQPCTCTWNADNKQPHAGFQLALPIPVIKNINSILKNNLLGRKTDSFPQGPTNGYV